MKKIFESKNIMMYQGGSLLHNESVLILKPHKLLRPYIANYIFTCPMGMPDEQTVLPSASSTLVYSLDHNHIISGLRGVGSKPVRIGGYAGQFHFMTLIEFHPGGLYPFLKISQAELLDQNFEFGDIHWRIDRQIREAVETLCSIDELASKLDDIFLYYLGDNNLNPALPLAVKMVVSSRGIIGNRKLAGGVYYSEKQLNRLFKMQIGMGVKTFSRIVRMKYAIDLINRADIGICKLTELTGHYDPSHFVRDFKCIYDMTPAEYKSKKSFFYNDPYKLSGYHDE